MLRGRCTCNYTDSHPIEALESRWFISSNTGSPSVQVGYLRIFLHPHGVEAFYGSYSTCGCVGRQFRGNLVSLYQFNIALGEVFGYVVAAIFLKVEGNWRYMLGSSIVSSTLMLKSASCELNARLWNSFGSISSRKCPTHHPYPAWLIVKVSLAAVALSFMRILWFYLANSST